jgi:gliding motility-associated-like protein
MKKTVLLLAFAVFAFAASAQITSTFDTDADGWTFSNNGTPVTVNHNASNGNPGGFVSTAPYSANSTATSQGWFAPAKFLGPHAAKSYGMNLRFDLQQSVAGTASSGQGDVRIVGNSGFDIVFSFPVKPAVAPAWSSYTLKLDETGGWRVNSTGGALATQADVIRALTNITTLEIRGTYITNASYVSGIDNVVLEQRTLDPSPVITSFAPMAGIPGVSISINGSNFGATAAQNTVYFGTTKGTITSVSATRIDVTVPAGAQYGPISVVNLTTGLRTKTNQSFNPLFDNNKDFGGEIIPASLSRGLNTVVQNGTEISNNTSSQGGTMGAGDMDGDGWVDLVGSELGTQTIYVFRNLGTGGTVGISSFAAPASLSVASIPLPGGTPTGMGEITVTDVDSDGRLDIITIAANVPTGGYLVVYRNTSTAGSISFASPVFFAYGYYSAQLRTTSADFDGDGRIDFVHTTGTSPGGIWLNQNLSTPGNVLFGYAQYIGPNNGRNDLSVGDLNGDGKPELIATRGVFEIHENNSVPGTISFNTPILLTGTSIVNFAIADLDADNKADLIWGGGAQVYFSRNIYSGGALSAASFDTPFQVPHLASNTYHIAVSDINGDGKPDVLASGDIDMAIFQNRGGATLSAASFTNSTLYQASVGATTRIYPSAPVIADLDGDNKPEVMLSHTNYNIPAAAKGIYIFHNESFPAPVVNSISPSSGNASTNVTLTGDFMFTGNVAPTIRLGGVSAVVNSPTNASTVTQVPAGAMSGKFTITNHGLTGFSSAFNLTFATDRVINASSFGPSIDFALANAVRDAIDVADFDDDGKVEVLVVDNFSTGKIFKNTHATAGQPINASSLTVESTTYGSGINLKALDIDGDGKIDLNSGFNLFQNTSTSSISFATGVTTRPTGFNYAAIADFNKDGKTDFALTDGTALIRVHSNQSSRGTYNPIGNFSPFSEAVVGLPKVNGAGGIVAADFDGDGYDDLIATNTVANSITIYRNEKVTGPITTSSFSLVGNNSVPGLQPYNITASDFDGDGKVDLAVTYFNSAFISIYRNTGSAGTISFAAAVDVTCLNKGYSIASQDLDGDGKAEIVVIHQPNPGPGSFSVFKNSSTSGTVSFATPINYALGRNPQALSIADINSDQKPDILIVASGGSIAPANALMVFENKTSLPIPTITSFTPASGPIGTTVTITGTNFDTTPANNIVYFGATRAVVTAATATQLTVTVPVGATYQPISVSVNNLIAYSSKPFITTFDGGGTIDACSFAPKQDLTAGMFPLSIASGDLDGDGMADMAVANYDNNIISLFRNTSSIGAISYAPKIDITSGANTDHISIGDLDGDGKLDLVVTDVGGASVYRNTSTGSGTISFAARISFAAGGSDPRHLAIADFDNDGKPDLVVANYAAGVNTISVLRNTSSGPGNISYAPKVDFASTIRPSSVSSGDLDGDGKSDIAVVNQNSSTLSVFRNTSTGIGNISFATKVDFTTGSNPLFVSIGDLDDDGKPELAVGYSIGTSSSVVSVFRNLSSGVGNISYAPKADFTVGSVPFSVSIGDMDGDGKPDLVATNVSSSNVSVLRNTSSGIGNISFAGKVDFTTNSNSQSVSITDFDGDGKPDLAATSFFGVHVLRNTISLAPSITSFTPANGTVGTTVIITGTNFSTTPSNNTVQFNGIPAVVISSAATSITTTIPTGATTGKITVTIGCNTATSASDFTVGTVTNEPPIIQPTTTAVPIDGIITIDLLPLISDPDDNLDLSTLSLVSSISDEGASAMLVGATQLELNYGNVVFAGTDRISISVCDLLSACTVQELSIEISGEIEIFNAVSPNNDNKNEIFRIANIDLLQPDNKVTIYNRWGSKVFEVENYNNDDRVFKGLSDNGSELPSGTYFYKITFSGRKGTSGYLVLKR